MHDDKNRLRSPDGSFWLERMDDRLIADSAAGISAFVTARNEIACLPFLFSYYRALGVHRFFFIDNGSTDGTLEYALAQPDTHAFVPSNTYSQSDNGIDWVELLLNTYGLESWTLVIDADEILIYPHCETLKLADFCAFLDQEGSTALFVFMLDMYPEAALAKAVCVPGTPFYDICSFFDTDYLFKPRRAVLPDGTKFLPAETVIGGPRLRLFYPWQRRTDVISRAVFKAIVALSDRLPLWKHDKPHYAPALIKVPLMKWHAGCKRLSAHIIKATPRTKLASVTGVFLHFKFFASFHEKAQLEAAREQHYGGGVEYKRYLSCIDKRQNVSFMYENSAKYAGSGSVLSRGLMRGSAALDSYVEHLSHPPPAEGRAPDHAGANS